MRDEQLEKRIADAVQHAAPDVLDRILSSYDEQKGNVISMSEIVNTNNKRNKRRWTSLVAVAAALALCVSVFGYNFWKSGSAVDSVVLLDVNPSISLTLNTREEVLSANALNEEAQVVLGDMDLKGTDLNVAVNAIIGSMFQNGYLSDLQNSILVSVENADEQRSAQLQEEISSAISSSFGSSGVGASVLSQTVTETDELTQLAQTYGISVGKAALIQEVVAQDSTLTVESLAPLSINEIALISSSRNLTTNTVAQTGSASDKAYIGENAALSAAAAHAGVSVSDVTWSKVEFDCDDGIMLYEVEFRTSSAEYECDVNATTGEVVKFEQEGGSTNAGTANSGTTNSGSIGTNNSTSHTDYIGEEAAKTAALADAGCKAEDTVYLAAWLEYDDGRPEHYEVEFMVGNTRYEYEIALTSATVIKSDRESYGNSGNSGTTGNTSGSTNYIGEDAALSAALTHAGLSSSDISGQKVEFDFDDGSAIYEIEFRSGRYEYEYEIDAVSGQVIKSEMDD